MKRKSIKFIILSIATIVNIFFFSVQPVYALDFSFVILSQSSAEMQVGEEFYLSSFSISEKEVTYKSSNSKVAKIDSDGLVTARKAGTATIIAKAGKATAKCKITVKQPTIKLSANKVLLYRNQTKRITVETSAIDTEPTFKCNKRSVAIIDEDGRITAMGHGQATVTVTIGGVSRTCDVLVLQPEIDLNATELTLEKGDSCRLTATVSSGNTPAWSSSNTSVVTVSSTGKIKAKGVGKAYVYATEDGAKAKCKVIVTE